MSELEEGAGAPPLKGRVALVTGASRRRGIGYAVVARLAELGASVFATGWSAHDQAQATGADPDLASALDELRRTGAEIDYLEADLGSPDGPARVVGAAVAGFGHVDILVANHARSGLGRLDAITPEEIDAFLSENVRSTLLLVKEFAAQHDDRTGGRVVLFTSGQHLGGMSQEVSYAASKGAIQQATRTLAQELMPRGITVNCINPGPTDTGYLAGEDPRPSMPLGRWGEPDDAARLVAWLAQDEARWITGQTIDSEGGFTR
jgi:3-oxoacyl-[acyl-carrier protein] reductase